MVNLPDVGLEAVLEGLQKFQAGAKKMEEAYEGLVQAEGRVEQASQKQAESTEKVATGWQKATGQIQGFVVAAGAAISAMALRQLGETAVELAKLGATAQRQETAFQDLAKQAGGSADDILAAIKRATDGTVADMDIIAAANKGLLLGLGAQADQWEQLTEVARHRARAMGLTVTQALDDITTGIGRESRMILDNLGIILDMDEVLGQYADSLGVATDALDAMDRKQAILTSVIEEGQTQIEAAGGIVSDAADQFERLDATLKNLKVSVGELLAEPISDWLGEIDNLLPGVLSRLLLVKAAIEGQISPMTAWEAAAVSGRIEQERGGEAALEYVESLLKLTDVAYGAADAHEDFRLVQVKGREASIDAAEAHEAWKLGIVDGADAAEEAAAATDGAATALEYYESASYQAAEAQRQLEGMVADATDEMEAQARLKLGEIAEKAQKKVVKAQQKADDARRKSHKRLMDAMEKMERDHAKAVEDILEDIAQIAVDLANDIAAAETEAHKAREKAHADMLDAIRDAEADAAEDRAELTRDLSADMLEAWEEYQAKLESITAAHEDRLLDLQEARMKEAEKLAADHADKLANIQERYAKERQAIEDRYVLDPEEGFDERRKALMEEIRRLKELQEAGGIRDYSAEIAAVQKQLDTLKNEELAALDERKKEELAELAAWLEEEEAVREAAYQEAKDAEDARWKEEQDTEEARYYKAEKKRLEQYDQDLADLKAKLQKEKETIRTAHREQLADIDKRLADERAKLDAAAEENRARLEQQVADERQSYADRQAELEIAHSKRIGEINREMDEEEETIRTKAELAAQKYIDEIDKMGPDARAALERMAANDLQPALDEWVRRFREMAQAAAQAVQDAMNELTHSPPPWAIAIGKDISEGLGIGMDKGMASFEGMATMIPSVIETQVSAPALPSFPNVGASSTQNVKNVNLRYTGAAQDYPSLRSLVALMEASSGG